MGVTAEMSFVFRREKHARWATHVVRGVVKVALARQVPLGERLGLEGCDGLAEAYAAHREAQHFKDYIAATEDIVAGKEFFVPTADTLVNQGSLH